MNDKKILGIVITYKETELCKKAIKSLANTGVDVALVFNGWSEKYLKWLDRFSGYIDYLFLNRNNIGFCRGNNQALSLAISERYDYAFLLNNDAWVEDDCITNLIRMCEKNEKIGIAQPKVYKTWNKNVLDTTGVIFKYGDPYSWSNGFGFVINRGEGEPDNGQYDGKTTILSCDGCAGMYRVKMLREVGLFMEKLWSMHEVTELAWRAYYSNWRAIYTPDAVAHHTRGHTASNKNCIDSNLMTLWDLIGYRNLAIIFRKYGNRKQRIFTSILWMHVGARSLVGKYLGKNCIGGKYIWLCSLAILHDKYYVSMEKLFSKLFSKNNIML